MDNDIKVSVICIAYNQKPYIRKCLDNFVNQKTNFKFEIVIHDDASTDGTKQIIEEYVNKYPNLFVPIYETENQYSKNVPIVDELMLPKAKGKYIAICEGDDYWCDENKLQLQYDFMEAHPECSACFHNTKQHDLSGHKKDHNFNNYKEIHYLTPKEVVDTGKIHTSSYFVRREIFKIPKFNKNYWFGDYVRITNYLLHGKLAVLPRLMSVYNANNTKGLTYLYYNAASLEKHIEKMNLIIDYLNEYNEFSNYKFKDSIQDKINAVCFSNESRRAFAKMKNCSRKEFYAIRNELKQFPYFKTLKQESKGLNKLKNFIKYDSPRWMWKLAFKFAKK